MVRIYHSLCVNFIVNFISIFCIFMYYIPFGYGVSRLAVKKWSDRWKLFLISNVILVFIDHSLHFPSQCSKFCIPVSNYRQSILLTCSINYSFTLTINLIGLFFCISEWNINLNNWIIILKVCQQTDIIQSIIGSYPSTFAISFLW